MRDCLWLRKLCHWSTHSKVKTSPITSTLNFLRLAILSEGRRKRCSDTLPNWSVVGWFRGEGRGAPFCLMPSQPTSRSRPSKYP